MKANATVHIDIADQEPPKFHCVYGDFDGEFAVKVADGDVTVYIGGTYPQLRDWATQFIGATIDGRSAVTAKSLEEATT